MSSKIIKVKGTEILLRKSPRSRNMNITVKPFGGVRITIPERVSFYEGEKLAHEKIRWIEEHVDKIPKERALKRSSYKLFPKRRPAATRFDSSLNELFCFGLFIL
ncbi:MAG: YgjP-like metallopeptidase domain-containing protein [Melioribacteraceae bacterium]